MDIQSIILYHLRSLVYEGEDKWKVKIKSRYTVAEVDF
jgi:hypothetical protein